MHTTNFYGLEHDYSEYMESRTTSSEVHEYMRQALEPVIILGMKYNLDEVLEIVDPAVYHEVFKDFENELLELEFQELVEQGMEYAVERGNPTAGEYLKDRHCPEVEHQVYEAASDLQQSVWNTMAHKMECEDARWAVIALEGL